MRVGACRCVCMHVYTRVHMHVYMCVHMRVHVCTCVRACGGRRGKAQACESKWGLKASVPTPASPLKLVSLVE